MPEFASIPYAGPARSRSGSYNKRYMVIHCTANDASPASEAAYARTRTDGVGMHFVSDPNTVLQVLESWYSTGHVGSTVGNHYGISWEFVGFLTSSPAHYRACVDRAAPAMKLVMAKYGIPHRWLSRAQMLDGVSKGLVTHKMCSDVFGGSDHTDPGPNFNGLYLVDALNGGTTMDPSDERYLRQQAAATAHLLPKFPAIGTGDDNRPVPLTALLGRLEAAAAADEARDAAVLAAVQALAAAGGVDAAPIVAAIQEVRNDTVSAVATLQAELAQARQRLAEALGE